MYSVDVIIKKKEKWLFKDILLKRHMKYMEWLVEFNSESSIISLEISNKEAFEVIFDFLKKQSPRSRIVLPNGNNIQPSKKDFEEIYSDFISKILFEE